MSEHTTTPESMASQQVRSGYAPVNGVNMYYEIYGEGEPLVLLHGAFSGIETSFGMALPSLSRGRQVIAVELQGHARTADIDRPLTIDGMAEDVIALLDYLELENADLFGYSMGSAVAMQVAISYPERVRKLVLASPSFNRDGMHPGHDDDMQGMKPEQLHGTPFHDEYMRLAPNPDAFPRLFAKVMQMSSEDPGWPAEVIRSIRAPAMIVIGDSDIVRPEHAVEMFRLLGGGVMGDIVGLPKSELAVLPGTTHITLAHRFKWLAPLIDEFLDR